MWYNANILPYLCFYVEICIVIYMLYIFIKFLLFYLSAVMFILGQRKPPVVLFLYMVEK